MRLELRKGATIEMRLKVAFFLVDVVGQIFNLVLININIGEKISGRELG